MKFIRLLPAGLALLLPAASHGAVDHGEILVDELSCTACHSPPAQFQDRFLGRQGPRLGAQGLRLAPQWLRAFLADPDAAIPGGSMPDMLRGLAPDARADAVADLTQYLVSREPPADDGFDWDPALIAKGRVLYHTVGCVACHAPSEPPPSASALDPRVVAEVQGLQQSSIALPDLPRMTSVPQLAAFLRDPVRFHPAGRMPSLRLGEDEATAIAAYLLRDQTPANPGAQTLPGVRYQYFEGRFNNLPNFSRLPVAAAGHVSHFDLSPRRRNDDIALLFWGKLNVPAEGQYRFFTESDDGSKLIIDGRTVVNNDHIHPMREAAGSIALHPGEHTIVVLYFNAAQDFGLEVSWQGPGFAKEEIPASALSYPGSRMKPIGDQPFAIDPVAAARGRALFAQLNCASCHHGDVPATKAEPLAALAFGRNDDCLGDAPAQGLPHYNLTPADRGAIRRFLGDRAALAQPLDAPALVERTMTLLNCYACHERGQLGGPDGFRRDYFSSIPPALDLGDEGRMPPHLNGVGAKLREDWLERVLMEGASVRPYMATRMPQFGAANVGFMPAAFLEADGAGAANPQLPEDRLMARAGRNLAGINGLACIACHNFGDHPSLGAPAIDLTVMAERLQTGWFHRYLIDPQGLRPGTRMPSFWPNGTALDRTALGGDTDRQIGALWAYLSRARAADPPDGLVHGRMELVAGKEAVIYRNFIRGVGPRAIGVGYPEKVDLAFDADDMRIALVWQGPFIDAAQHRTGRGFGAVPPMGHDIVAGPPGPPFARLESESDPWPILTGKNAGYRFRGYRLDDAMRPTFSYDFGPVHITDFPTCLSGPEETGLRRTLTFEADQPPPNLYLRAAIGRKIKPVPGGGFQVDDDIVLKFSEPAATVREAAGNMELLVPVRFYGNKATLIEDYIW